MTENQLSRWGAIAKNLPLMNPIAKVFLLANTSATYFGALQNEFPPDHDGYVRVESSLQAVLDNAGLQASRGDVVLALPGFAETLTATKSLSIAGVHWLGIGEGALTPTITVNVADHGIALTGANSTFENWRFAAPGTDAALSMVRIAAVGCKVKNVTGIGSDDANNFVHCITIKAGANDHTLENIKLSCGAVAVTAFLNFEGPVSRSNIGGFFAIGSVATGGIIDATGAYIENANWDNLRVCVGGSAKPAVIIDATGGSGGKGFVTNSRLAGTHTTLASNAQFVGDYRLSQVYVGEDTNNASQGALIPAADTD